MGYIFPQRTLSRYIMPCQQQDKPSVSSASSLLVSFRKALKVYQLHVRCVNYHLFFKCKNKLSLHSGRKFLIPSFVNLSSRCFSIGSRVVCSPSDRTNFLGVGGVEGEYRSDVLLDGLACSSACVYKEPGTSPLNASPAIFNPLCILSSCSECTRGGFCNFMHLKPISRELRRELYGRRRKRY